MTVLSGALSHPLLTEGRDEFIKRLTTEEFKWIFDMQLVRDKVNLWLVQTMNYLSNPYTGLGIRVVPRLHELAPCGKRESGGGIHVT